VAGGIHAEHIGERPNLRPLVLEGRRFDPGVFSVFVEVVIFRIGLTLVRMQRGGGPGILIPGVFDRFLDAITEEGVLIAGDRLEL
jgi:hypothetical protein